MPHMQKEREIISLIPYGLPQFLDFSELCGKPVKKSFREEAEVIAQENNRQDTHIRLSEVVDPDEFGFGRDGDIYDISSEKHIGVWLNQWLPVPFLRRSGDTHPDNDEPRFRSGPTNWARAYLTRIPAEDDPEKFMWRAVLAFDMQVEEPQPDMEEPGKKKHAALSPDDVTARAVCSLAYKSRDNSWFLSEGWVDSWLKGVWDSYIGKKEHRRERPRCRDGRETENQFDYLATYIVYLELLNQIIKGTSVSIINLSGSQDTASDEQSSDIVEVDLILDIGNSRSTGILVENQLGKNTDLNDSYPLQLRDLSCPFQFYSDPFETRVEFSKVNFGNDSFSKRSGRMKNAFAWASPVRTGPEASRLANCSSNAEGISGMTSPKRYLWDEGPASNLWYFNRTDSKMREEMVSTHPICRFLNDNGLPLQCARELSMLRSGDKSVAPTYITRLFTGSQDRSEQLALPAAMPRFSRSSMMMFLFMELIQQALVTMNSPAQRYRRAYPDRPRRLRRVIFTAPPGMPFAEQRIYRRWAYSAVKVLWDALGWKNFYIEPHIGQKAGRDYRMSPEVSNRWDEATCTQLVYLFNEINRNYQGDAHLFFEVMGKGRDVPCEDDPAKKEKKPTLRVATVDIGGGTTDLSVITYVLANNKDSTNRIWPKQEFRDGFNFGGDDVLKAIVSDIILSKAIIESLTKLGVGEHVAGNAVREMFGHTSDNIRIQNLRIQFVRQVAMPVAYHLLSLYEKKSRHDTSGDLSVSMRSLFQHGEDGTIITPSGPLQNEVVEFFNSTLSSVCGRTFSVMDMELCVRCEDMDDVIASFVRDKLNALGEIVHTYDCDLLLLSGRPSRWNAVVRQVFAMPPVAPDRIVPMHEYLVGPWYPFATPSGKITDPKTTVVTGAILCALAENSIEGFVFDSSLFNFKSTARYIGELNPQGELSREMVWFDIDPAKSKNGAEYSKVVNFSAPITIGFRQIENPRWTATRCWRMEFASEEARRNAVGRTPYKITVNYEVKPLEYDEGYMPEEKKDITTNPDMPDIPREPGAIVDKSGNDVPSRAVRIYLRTLNPKEEDGCWMDTGVLFG